MTQPKRVDSVRNIVPRPDEMLARIQHLAADSKNVGFSDHAEDRMEERGITDLDVFRVLRTGEISGAIEPGKHEGEWKCKVVAPVKGRREVGVATLVIRNRKLRIKTVEWEDLK
jgi:hypothetical protein